ncbi:MAG TPA: nucleotide kinase domain-containing protein, partial [Tepidisphaeraceae bacterium]
MAQTSSGVRGTQRKRRRNSSRDAAAEALPVVVRRACQPVPSPVYETYWRFAHERQEVFFRRVELQPPPWTADLILRAHRFTNSYRASDRVSQYLIRNVIYAGGYDDIDDVLFRILVFKFFNRVDTWELLDRAVGGVRWSTYSFDAYDDALTRATALGQRIYSGAYIMPACAALGNGRKHRGHLRLIESIVRDGLSRKLADAMRLAEAFRLLRSYPMLGDFLAYQYAIDLNYSTLTKFSEDEFVVPGPGARDGLRKVFSDPGDYAEADLIRWVAERQEAEFDRLGLPFRT